MLSYWEQQSFTKYDHIIIGSGIVGLSTAIELKERQPAASVLVLERGLLPTGASTRNAGFACMGSLTELTDDTQYNSADEMVALYEQRKLGLEKLRARLGDARIGYRANGSYELLNEAELPALERLEELNALLLPVTGKPAFRIANEKIASSGFAAGYVKAMIENICEGELHTGMMMRALMDKAITAGVEIRTGADVRHFEEEENEVAVLVKDHFRKEEWWIVAGKLVICTNAFTPQLLPGEDVKPGRGQVLITRPVQDLPFKGVYHMDKGYYYFREIDGRVLLGGGRNLDFAGETTTEMGLTEQIQTDLERKLHEIILPGRNVLIERRWAGIMAFGASKQPVVKAFSGNVYGGFRMGGMGVALGSEVASKLAGMVAEGM